MGAEPLSETERAIYEWQMWMPGFGEAGQEKLKGASVLISRCGGVGGSAALQLAAAGVGKLVLAHGGDLKWSDLNRQVLMKADRVGRSRVGCASETLRQLNPRIEIVAVPENINESNAARLVGQADLVLDCAPLFVERYLMNREAVRQGKILVECAMHAFEVQLTTIIPGRTGCLACLYPEAPGDWTRQFPVFGSVSGTAGCLGAVEAIKALSGTGELLVGRVLVGDLRSMSFRTVKTTRDPQCQVCGS